MARLPYEAMTNEQLWKLLKKKMPEADVFEVNDYNRRAVIALLQFVNDDTPTPRSHS